MIVTQFQSWARTASPPHRADGVSALARAYLYSDLSADQRRASVGALTAFLDDPSPLVRRAMAHAFAGAAAAPHHIILALAEDQPSIAEIVLRRSPVLNDADLADLIGGSDSATHEAIASRPRLSAGLCAILAEIGAPATLTALVSNQDADLPEHTMARVVTRHGDHGALREALLARGNLPTAIRIELVAATARALATFVTQRDWLSDERSLRITREAGERATVAITAADHLDAEEMAAVAAGLRAAGRLTVALAFRALLSNNRPLFCAMLSDLSGVASSRVEGLAHHVDSAGFAALYRKAGLPLTLLPAFRIALAAVRGAGDEPGASLSSRLVARVIEGCEAIDDRALDRLVALLRRFETEAAREEARTKPPSSFASGVAVARAPTPDMSVPQAAIDFDEAIPMERAIPMAEPQPARFTIDLAAIEAELLAA